MTLLVSETGQAFWRKTTVVVGNCMMREVGWNQRAAGLYSSPGSHLYHTEPNRTPNVRKTINTFWSEKWLSLFTILHECFRKLCLSRWLCCNVNSRRIRKGCCLEENSKRKEKKNGRRFSLAHFCNNVIVHVISTWGINKPPN